MPQVSLLATLLATVFGLCLAHSGTARCSGRPGCGGRRQRSSCARVQPVKTYGVTFVLAFLASYVFGMFLGRKPGGAFGVGAGAAAGVCWVAVSLWTNDLFERRLALTLINGGYHAVKFILMGLSFALIG